MKKRNFIILILMLFGLINTLSAQDIDVVFSIEKDSVSYGDSVLVKWNVKNSDKVFIIPFGLVPKQGEQEYIIESDCTLILIAQNEIDLKIERKHIALNTNIKGIESGNDEDYAYPIKGKVAMSLLAFSEKLEDVLQNQLRFSLLASGSTKGNSIAIKTNLADRDYLLVDDDKKNKINKRRISYLVTYEIDYAENNKINFVIKALIQKKKIIKLNYTKETNEDFYHTEIIKLKSLLEN